MSRGNSNWKVKLPSMLKAVLFLLKVFGCFPHSLKAPKPELEVVKKPTSYKLSLAFWTSSVMLLFYRILFTFLVFNIWLNSYSNPEMSPIISQFMFIGNNVWMYSDIISTMIIFYNRRRMARIVKCLLELFNDFGLLENCAGLSVTQGILVALILAAKIFAMNFSFYGVWKSISLIFLIVNPLLVLIVIRMIVNGLESIQGKIEQSINTAVVQERFYSNIIANPDLPRSSEGKWVSILLSQKKLDDSIDLISRVFGYSMLLLIVDTFLCSLWMTFYLVRGLLTTKSFLGILDPWVTLWIYLRVIENLNYRVSDTV